MASNNNCIYEVFKWMGLTLKYLGFIPQPALDETRSQSRFLLSILLPFLFWTTCAVAVFDITYMGMNRNLERNLTDILAFLIVILFAISALLFPTVFYFRMSNKLVDYLQLHAEIDRLIKPHQNRLKLMANIFLISDLIIRTIATNLYSYGRFAHRYNGEYMVYETFTILNFLYLSICPTTQVMYIVFQYVLTCAFKELLKRIQEEEKKVKSGSLEDARKKLRMYGALYRSLCQMGKLLDDMTSPLIAYQFLFRFIATVESLTFITFDLSLESVSSMLELVLSAIVLVFIPVFAHETKNAASKIVSAAYLSFDLNDKQIAKEMHIFAAQMFQFKVEFSASGLFKLDKNLALNVIQSIISQWVVFYKIKIE